MITHAEYMANASRLHHAYYLEIAREAGISYAQSAKLARIEQALTDGDQWLNSIPLAQWDADALYTKQTVARALKARGTFWSMATGVCVQKAAAIEDARNPNNAGSSQCHTTWSVL